jgi:HAD superfamily hydrolase (TIGR01509 family)
MKWIKDYQLFLFDFDGILVNTEELHYLAYLKMCAERGYSLFWDQKTYMSYALYSATGVKEGIYQALPKLRQEEPDWNVLYEEKKRHYYTLLQNMGPPLIKGVSRLLETLEASGVKRCVVTHSPGEQIDYIRSMHPVLNTIPHWIAREHYSQPKPSSECYQKAIGQLKSPGDRVIGFEDSPRGLQALLGTEARGVLISDVFNNDELQNISKEMSRSFAHFHSFGDMFEEWK